MNLHNKVIVVTGAANGIGRACAIEFARRGADVVLADIDEDGSQQTADEVTATGRAALVVPTDVGDREQVEALVERAIGWQGQCDVFHSNAGIGVGGPPHLIPLDDWDAALRINLWSCIWAARTILPHMLDRGSGALVFTSSPAGLLGGPMLAPYTVTKWALNGWAESLAAYCKPKGITVSIAMPGYAIATDVTRNARVTMDGDGDHEHLREVAGSTWHRIGVPPERFAEAIAAGVEADAFYICDPANTLQAAITKWQDPDAWLDATAADVAAGGVGTDPLITSPSTAEKLV